MFRKSLLLLLTSAVAACAGLQQPIPFDRGGTPAIQTIGILTPYVPATVSVPVAGAGEEGPGLIIILAAAAVRSSRESRVNAALSSRQFVAAPLVTEEITKAVAAQGYRTVAIGVERPNWAFLEKYPTPAAADAWLDCSVSQLGYFAASAGDSSPFRPYMTTRCRLVRASDGAVMMHDAVLYNPARNTGVGKFVALSPDPNFSFNTSDLLAADPDRAVEGLNVAIRTSTAAIGTLLK